MAKKKIDNQLNLSNFPEEIDTENSIKLYGETSYVISKNDILRAINFDDSWVKIIK